MTNKLDSFEFHVTSESETCQCENCEVPATIVVNAKNRSEQMYFCVEHARIIFPRCQDSLVEMSSGRVAPDPAEEVRLSDAVLYYPGFRGYTVEEKSECQSCDSKSSSFYRDIELRIGSSWMLYEDQERNPPSSVNTPADDVAERIKSQRTDLVDDKDDNPFEGDKALKTRVLDYLSSPAGASHVYNILSRIWKRNPESALDVLPLPLLSPNLQDKVNRVTTLGVNKREKDCRSSKETSSKETSSKETSGKGKDFLGWNEKGDLIRRKFSK